MKSYRAQSDESVVNRLCRNSFIIWMGVSTTLVLGSCLVYLWLMQQEVNKASITFVVICCCALVLTGLSVIAHLILRRFSNLLLTRLATVRRSTQDAGHELATPVAILKTRLQLMEREAVQAESMRANLAVLTDATERMATLIDDIRVLSLAEDPSKCRDLSVINFSEMVKSVTMVLRPECERNGITLILNVSQQATIIGELDTLRTVVNNLVTNAIRYNQARGKIEVTLETKDERVILSVENEGEGIPAEALPRVFDRFYRASTAPSHAQGGTGLGLAIVKAIVEAHSGSVSVESEQNQSTRFLVELPRFPDVHPLIGLTKNIRAFPWS